jgi:hypothetical protein
MTADVDAAAYIGKMRCGKFLLGKTLCLGRGTLWVKAGEGSETWPRGDDRCWWR